MLLAAHGSIEVHVSNRYNVIECIEIAAGLAE